MKQGGVVKLSRGFVLLCLFALSACSSSSTLDNPDTASPAATPEDSKQTISTIVTEPGDYDLTLSTEGMERSYLLHIPTGYDGSKSLPLVFVLHGYGGTAEGMVTITDMSDKADQKNFIVAYLNGAGEGPSWNNGLTNTSSADDVAFVRTLASQLKEELNVDGTRVYAAGFSNGGMMSHRLARSSPMSWPASPLWRARSATGNPTAPMRSRRHPSARSRSS
jgi:polyhydroxybutyrate depolymerase